MALLQVGAGVHVRHDVPAQVNDLIKLLRPHLQLSTHVLAFLFPVFAETVAASLGIRRTIIIHFRQGTLFFAILWELEVNVLAAYGRCVLYNKAGLECTSRCAGW